MSSYLIIYGKLKPEYKVDKPVALLSVSRNNDLYQAFHEQGTTFAYKNGTDEMQYTEITSKFLGNIENDLNKTINDVTKKISLIEKHLPEKAEERLKMVQEISDWQEYLEEQKIILHYIWFLQMLLEEIDNEYSNFEKLLCNVD